MIDTEADWHLGWPIIIVEVSCPGSLVYACS